MPHTLIYLFIHRDRIHGAASSLSEHIRLITPLTTDSCNHDLKSTCHASLFFWTAYRVASHLCPCAFPPSAPWKCTTLIMTNNSTLHACPFSRDCFQGGQSFVSEYICPVSSLEMHVPENDPATPLFMPAPFLVTASRVASHSCPSTSVPSAPWRRSRLLMTRSSKSIASPSTTDQTARWHNSTGTG